jgi:glycosyltransferase involved in cell wall biosynthesis
MPGCPCACRVGTTVDGVPDLSKHVLASGDRRLRVVFVDHGARLSGGELALLRLLPELSKHVDVTVLLGEEGPLLDRLRDQNIRAEVIPLAPRVRDLRRESVRPAAIDIRALAALPPYVLRLRRRIRDLEPDLVHTNSLKAALYGGIAGRLAGVPTIWHIRDRVSRDYLPRPAVELVRLVSRVVPNAVIANSHETMSTLPRRWPSDVLYNPVAPDTVRARDDSTDETRASLVVGMVGRLAPWKGQDVFLDAFAEAFRGTDVRARLIGSALFGEDKYAASLEERAECIGIASQVEFRGFKEDVWGELRELDVLVHCSVRPEPFGQVVLEGLAAGVPVVAANAGGPAELITNDVDGILTPPGSVTELAAALLRLADDSDLRTRLSTAGRRRSLDFTPERAVSRLLAFYERVLQPR